MLLVCLKVCQSLEVCKAHDPTLQAKPRKRPYSHPNCLQAPVRLLHAELDVLPRPHARREVGCAAWFRDPLQGRNVEEDLRLAAVRPAQRPRCTESTRGTGCLGQLKQPPGRWGQGEITSTRKWQLIELDCRTLLRLDHRATAAGHASHGYLILS